MTEGRSKTTTLRGITLMTRNFTDRGAEDASTRDPMFGPYYSSLICFPYLTTIKTNIYLCLRLHDISFSFSLTSTQQWALVGYFIILVSTKSVFIFVSARDASFLPPQCKRKPLKVFRFHSVLCVSLVLHHVCNFV